MEYQDSGAVLHLRQLVVVYEMYSLVSIFFLFFLACSADFQQAAGAKFAGKLPLEIQQRLGI